MGCLGSWSVESFDMTNRYHICTMFVNGWAGRRLYRKMDGVGGQRFLRRCIRRRICLRTLLWLDKPWTGSVADRRWMAIRGDVGTAVQPVSRGDAPRRRAAERETTTNGRVEDAHQDDDGGGAGLRADDGRDGGRAAPRPRPGGRPGAG